jgi:DNA modification methylase
MTFKTEVLNFSIGGFSGDYERIIWQNDKLYHFFERNFNDEELDKVLDFSTPSTKDWEEFWNEVDALNVNQKIFTMLNL